MERIWKGKERKGGKGKREGRKNGI